MFITTASASLEILLGGAVATTAANVVADWVDITTSTFTPGVTAGTVNSATPVTVVGSPAGSTQRQIKTVTVYNADTASIVVTMRYNDGSSTYKLVSTTLRVGETLQYIYDMGWVVTDQYGGSKKGNAPIVFPEQPFHMNQCLTAFNLNGSIAGAGAPVYVGKATKAYTTVDVHYQIIVGATTVTWAELAVGTGPNTIETDVHLTVRGFTDISTPVLTNGLKTTTVTLSGIQPGDDLYVMAAAVYTGTLTIGRTAVDFFTSGFGYTWTASLATAHRPSLDVNHVMQYTPTANAALFTCMFT